MDLPSTFEHKGWQIKYNLLGPQTQHTKVTRVLFVHGTPWSSIVFKPLIQALVALGSYQILVYDLPGYGRSQTFDANVDNATANGFPGNTSVAFQGAALAGLLQQTAFEKPTVIAHDIAGTIVLRSHLIHNVEFESMVLMDTNVVLPWGDGFYKLVRSQPQPFLELPPSIFEAVVRAVIQSAVHNKGVLQSGWEDSLAQPWLGSKDAQTSFVRQIAQANDQDVKAMLDSEVYSHVRCDVKVIWGEDDQWIPQARIEELKSRFQGRVKSSVHIPNAGHLVMLDQPERVAIEILKWLNPR